MIDKLELLLALAKERHFGRAAEKDGGFSWEKTYLADALIALVLLVLLVVMREPHPSAGAGPLGIPRPQVPKEIRGRFVFAVIGAGAAWAVLTGSPGGRRGPAPSRRRACRC